MEPAGVSLWGPGDKTQRRLKVQKLATNKEEEEEEEEEEEYPTDAGSQPPVKHFWITPSTRFFDKQAKKGMFKVQQILSRNC